MTVQAAEHELCVMCGAGNPTGFHLRFTRTAPDEVVAEFTGGAALEGYRGLLHGGITSALVDGAMTNCLFSLGIVAVTAELTVRYLAELRADRQVRITARRCRSRGPLHELTAEIRQDGRLAVRARGKFLDRGRGRGAAAVAPG
jgi:acyl-coenzyme A thioesterase PaaI-like protein